MAKIGSCDQRRAPFRSESEHWTLNMGTNWRKSEEKEKSAHNNNIYISDDGNDGVEEEIPFI